GLAAITLLGLHLEDCDFGSAIVFAHRSLDRRALDNRCSDGYAAVARNHDNAVDFNLVPRVSGHLLYTDGVADGDAVVPTACFNYRVHGEASTVCNAPRY